MPIETKAWETAQGGVFGTYEAALDAERAWALNVLANQDQAALKNMVTSGIADFRTALRIINEWNGQVDLAAYPRAA